MHMSDLKLVVVFLLLVSCWSEKVESHPGGDFSPFLQLLLPVLIHGLPLTMNSSQAVHHLQAGGPIWDVGRSPHGRQSCPGLCVNVASLSPSAEAHPSRGVSHRFQEGSVWPPHGPPRPVFTVWRVLLFSVAVHF